MTPVSPALNRPRSRTRTGLATLGVALLVALTGCGGDAAGQSGDTLRDQDLVFENALTVCSDMPYEPFEYLENGQPTGFDIDLVRPIAEKLDVQLDVIDVTFDDITSGTVLNEGQCDLAVSAITISGERARVLDFSSPYFASKQALVAPQSSGLSSLEALAGQRVGVQADTTGETFLRDFAPQGTKIVPFGDAAELTSALTDGGIEAAIFDNTVSSKIVEDNPGMSVMKEFDTGEQYGMAVQKDGNIPLLRTINDVLAELRANGEYDKIYKKYF